MVAAVLTSIEAILDAVAPSALVAKVAPVFTPIAPILTPVAPILAPIPPVFETISPAALRRSGKSRHGQCRENQRSHHKFAQSSHHVSPSGAVTETRCGWLELPRQVKGQKAKGKGQV
jgi:hypothetical protein